MKKKLIYVLLLITCLMVLPFTSTQAARLDKSKKVQIDYKGLPLYASIAIHVDTDGEFNYNEVLINNISASYSKTDDTFYFSVKRSDINEAYKSGNYSNTAYNFQPSIDFYPESDNYYLLRQFDYTSTDCGYDAQNIELEYDYKEYGYYEVASTGVPVSGLSAGYQSSYGGMKYIVPGKTELPVSSDTYCLSEFDVSNAIIATRGRIYISVIEDVQMDLGTITNVVDGIDQETGTQQNMDVSNFYAEYLENNKLNYSWTTYDKDGNPISVDYNTEIKFDDTENEEEIYNLFDESVKKDKIKILSFSHEGNLNGTAKISIYVGDKFNSGEELKLYYFNPKEEQLEDTNLDENDEPHVLVVDNEGYITFEITHCSDYVLALNDAKILDKANITKVTSKTNGTNIIVGIVIVAILVIGATVTIIIKNKKSKKLN